MRRKPADSRRAWSLYSSMQSSRSLRDVLLLGADLCEKLGQEDPLSLVQQTQKQDRFFIITASWAPVLWLVNRLRDQTMECSGMSWRGQTELLFIVLPTAISLPSFQRTSAISRLWIQRELYSYFMTYAITYMLLCVICNACTQRKC